MMQQTIWILRMSRMPFRAREFGSYLYTLRSPVRPSRKSDPKSSHTQ